MTEEVVVAETAQEALETYEQLYWEYLAEYGQLAQRAPAPPVPPRPSPPRPSPRPSPSPPPPRYVKFTNTALTALADINARLRAAVDALALTHCRRITSGECAVVPLLPKSDSDARRYLDPVVSGYKSDDWVVTVPAGGGSVDLLGGRIKPETAAMVIAGFAVETTASIDHGMPVTRIEIYADMEKRKRVMTVNALMAVAPMDYPLAYVMLETPVFLGPNTYFTITAYGDSRLASAIDRAVVILPPVVLVPRAKAAYTPL
jgi:hypothetical protein